MWFISFIEICFVLSVNIPFAVIGLMCISADFSQRLIVFLNYKISPVIKRKDYTQIFMEVKWSIFQRIPCIIYLWKWILEEKICLDSRNIISEIIDKSSLPLYTFRKVWKSWTSFVLNSRLVIIDQKPAIILLRSDFHYSLITKSRHKSHKSRKRKIWKIFRVLRVSFAKISVLLKVNTYNCCHITLIW